MKIQISHYNYSKIMHWINKTTHEVSGFGTITYDKDKEVFFVEDVFLAEQENSYGSTDLDAGSLSKLMYKQKENAEKLKWWWHSHVNMDVFWSGTDRKTIEELGQQGWITATVFNKRNEMRSAACVKTTSALMGEGIQFNDNIPTIVLPVFYAEESVKAWDTEFTTNVKEKSYAAYKGGGGKRGKKGVSIYRNGKWEEEDAEADQDLPAHRLPAHIYADAAQTGLTAIEIRDKYHLYKEGHEAWELVYAKLCEAYANKGQNFDDIENKRMEAQLPFYNTAFMNYQRQGDLDATIPPYAPA